MIAPIIILLATLENIWPVIAGYLETPKGYIFLGTIHHPFDYFYYLSQFAQGTTRLLKTTDLYTSEPIPASFVGWSNVFAGAFFHILSVPPVGAYIISMGILTVSLLISAYYLCRRLATTRGQLLTSFYLFALYHAFPSISGSTVTYNDYWNNVAAPSVRLGHVPHQLLITTLSLIAMRYLLEKNHQWKSFTILTITGFLLSSLQPVLWALLVMTIGISVTTYGLLHKYKLKQLSTYYRPVIFFALGGIIPALYLTKLFTTLPFLQLKLWEQAQQNQFSLLHFLLATGPVFVIALLSLPHFFDTKDLTKLSVVVYIFFSFTLFLSPIPHLAGLTSARFMSTLGILLISVIAASGIKKRIAVLILLTLLLVPSHIRSFTLANTFEPGNAYQYLSRSDYTFLVRAGAAGGPKDTYLLIWPYNVVFPGLTGRRSYNGHPLLTIDAAQKDHVAQRIFDGNVSSDELKTIAKEAHISYIIAYTWTPNLNKFPFLTQIRATPTLVLYKLNINLL